MYEYYPSGDAVLTSGQTMSLECSVETITGRGDDVTGEFEAGAYTRPLVSSA
jgi:hypothetical protein